MKKEKNNKNKKKSKTQKQKLKAKKNIGQTQIIEIKETDLKVNKKEEKPKKITKKEPKQKKKSSLLDGKLLNIILLIPCFLVMFLLQFPILNEVYYAFPELDAEPYLIIMSIVLSVPLSIFLTKKIKYRADRKEGIKKKTKMWIGYLIILGYIVIYIFALKGTLLELRSSLEKVVIPSDKSIEKYNYCINPFIIEDNLYYYSYRSSKCLNYDLYNSAEYTPNLTKNLYQITKDNKVKGLISNVKEVYTFENDKNIYYKLDYFGPLYKLTNDNKSEKLMTNTIKLSNMIRSYSNNLYFINNVNKEESISYKLNLANKEVTEVATDEACGSYGYYTSYCDYKYINQSAPVYLNDEYTYSFGVPRDHSDKDTNLFLYKRDTISHRIVRNEMAFAEGQTRDGYYIVIHADNDMIYYLNIIDTEEKLTVNLYKVNMNEMNSIFVEKLTDITKTKDNKKEVNFYNKIARNLKVSDGSLYYTNDSDHGYIYKLDLASGNKSKVIEEENSTFIYIKDGSIYYTKIDLKTGKSEIYYIKDSEKIKLA